MTACILWDGYVDRDGYGVSWRRRRRMQAHRRVWQECFGDIAAGHVVHHLCGVKRCINPEHLQLLTAEDHMRLHFNTRAAVDASREATACAHGHEWTPENTRLHHGRRQCRACERVRSKRRAAAGYYRDLRAKARADG